MSYFSVDRIEEDLVVCEDESGNESVFKISQFPKNIKEGDIVEPADDGSFKINHKKTQEVRNDILRLRDEIYK